MATQVAFLRAVNVGKRTVQMARVAEIFEALGYNHVWTYINSGNVIFDVAGRGADLESAIEGALEAEFGFEITTFVRTVAEVKQVLTAAPFVVAGGDTYFVTFLKSVPSVATARALESLSNGIDTLIVRGRDVHWLMHGKSTESLLRAKDWAIVGKHHSTSRNVTMLQKLRAKLDPNMRSA